MLGKLLEELGELTSATSRCLIQGIDETEPTTGKPNRLWLEEEVADVLACLDIVLMQFPVNGMALQLRTERKVERLKAWLALT